MTGKKEKAKDSGKVVVVRIRGDIDIRREMRETLRMLGLRRVNWTAVLDPAPATMGMVRKVKDFVTWGEIDGKTLSALVAKWGRKAGGARLGEKEAEKFSKDFLAGKTTFKKAGIKPYFKLHPPTGGHARGGVKNHFNIGGVLGYRGGDINKLLAKMAGLKDGAKK